MIGKVVVETFSLAARGPYGGWVSPHLVVTHSNPAGGLVLDLARDLARRWARARRRQLSSIGVG